MTDLPMPNVAECSYCHLDTGIHELVFKSSSASAVHELFILLNHLYDGKTRRDPPLRLLIDASLSGIPPLVRLMPGVRKLVAQHPNRPEVQYAFILPDGSSHLISTLEAFIRVLRPTNKVRSFNSSERAAAIAWLLGDQAIDKASAP